MHYIIRVYPDRVTPKGRLRPPEYLARVNYPPLLSGEKPTATLVQHSRLAMQWRVDTAAQSTAELLRHIGYNQATVIEVK